MSEVKENVVYRCPLCLFNLNDVIIDLYPDGLYHCVKCGFTGTEKDILAQYDNYRKRYKLRNERLSLEAQRNL
jgi:hypothetical protein